MSQIRLMRPYIGFDEVEAEFREVFDSGIFTRGQHVDAFRSELAAYTGAKHAFLTTSATTSLWVCLKLLGIGPGDEVIVSDFSFPASANVIEDVGARPVFADVCPETFNMRPEVLEALIGPRTKAVMFVDALGNPTGITEIKRICSAKRIPLIEDAACAIGSSEKGARCGAIADLTCFSFHPRKLISTGEGGAITTNSDEWADWLTVKLAHGANGMKGVALDFVDYGYNFRLSELQAVMGRKQLAKIDSIVRERNEIRERYMEQLGELGFVAQKSGSDVVYNVQSMVFRVPEGCDRDRLIADLRGTVETTIGTYALSSGSYFLSKYRDVQPTAAQLEATTITFPCFTGLDVGAVAAAVRAVLR
ncbi:DegT/DnrJ/EryC1/StrS family aminotransferase [Pseudomonas berkeleyensis]|uniref:DegT/DnrJ/EryC1/StrS family aminotransferase n=1 Tax=Pseudomonas berkeleyensis TaxID=2726956 RepID=A0A7G5DHZ9_9PSED|nr:DegT/DnrJ/EryC1/StrS family aminotransferase [Pseudomonas berkeleyensis]QMV61374.1 DegT/DnrJ/EryC1/StrS family aminotransferase [Pseudomonas berkeleyensis]WSO36803.1 DegT/DnrJ/EryC1/StrS family aminotransferase [Pseudomonas berkeleyensis]